MIFYFSSTGNSLTIAKQLAKLLQDEYTVIGSKALEKDYSSENRIGFVFPTFYCSVPKFIEDFMMKIRLNSKAYIYLVNTCGGIQGVSLYNAKKVLEKRSLKISYAKSISMPDNTATIYSSSMAMDSLRDQKEFVSKIAKDILDGKTDVAEAKFTVLGAVTDVIGGPAMKLMANIMISDKDKCVGCGICAKVCPMHNIEIVNGRPLLSKNCVDCMSCLHWCPQAAIHFKVGSFSKERQYHHPDVKLAEIMEDRNKA